MDSQWFRGTKTVIKAVDICELISHPLFHRKNTEYDLAKTQLLA